jgi:hypothetical protein
VNSDRFGRVEVDEYNEQTGAVRVLGSGLPWLDRGTYEPASADSFRTWPPLEPPYRGWSHVAELAAVKITDSGDNTHAGWWNDETHAIRVPRPGQRLSFGPNAHDYAWPTGTEWVEVAAGSYRSQDPRFWPPLLPFDQVLLDPRAGDQTA